MPSERLGPPSDSAEPDWEAEAVGTAVERMRRLREAAIEPPSETCERHPDCLFQGGCECKRRAMLERPVGTSPELTIPDLRLLPPPE